MSSKSLGVCVLPSAAYDRPLRFPRPELSDGLAKGRGRGWRCCPATRVPPPLAAMTDGHARPAITPEAETGRITPVPVAKRQCLTAPSPSPSLSPPPPGDSRLLTVISGAPAPPDDSRLLTVISGDRHSFYVDRAMICAASTFIRNTLTDTLCELLNLPPWLHSSSLRSALQHTRQRESSRGTPADQEAMSNWEREFVAKLTVESDQAFWPAKASQLNIHLRAPLPTPELSTAGDCVRSLCADAHPRFHAGAALIAAGRLLLGDGESRHVALPPSVRLGCPAPTPPEENLCTT